MNKITVKLSVFEWAYGIALFFVGIFSIMALITFPIFMSLGDLSPFFMAQLMWFAFAATPFVIYFLFAKKLGDSKKNHIEISQEGINFLGSKIVIRWDEMSRIGAQGILTFHQGWDVNPYLSFELKDKSKLAQIKSVKSYILTPEVIKNSFFGPDKLDLAINMTNASDLPNQEKFEEFIKRCGQKVEYFKPLIQTNTQEKYDKLKEEFFQDLK